MRIVIKSPVNAPFEKVAEDFGEEKYVFVDTGEKLPFGLKQWEHIHTIKKTGDNSTVIIDDMSYSSGIRLFDLFIYPVLFLSFSPRKTLYKKYFER